ncbi:MAG: antibiotic biosynthesis monooxygenase [Actinomycetota bacterium]|nr:antibiotic biosynthesis monooxygenase [Actinomycetota bacterium]
MLAVNRLRAFGDADEQVLDELAVLIDVLAGMPGFRSARAGCCIDEPGVWLMLSEWESVGTYRRAMSSHAVKATGYPVFVRIVDEPGAYEVLLSTG